MSAMAEHADIREAAWQNPWFIPGAFRSPSYSQALYPNLKTHMIEHHWLQQARATFTPG